MAEQVARTNTSEKRKHTPAAAAGVAHQHSSESFDNSSAASDSDERQKKKLKHASAPASVAGYDWLFPGATVRFAACFRSKRGYAINTNIGVVLEILKDGMIKVVNVTWRDTIEHAEPHQLRKALPKAGKGVVFVHNGEHRGTIGYLVRRSWKSRSQVRPSRDSTEVIEVNTSDLIGLDCVTFKAAECNNGMNVDQWLVWAPMALLEFSLKHQIKCHNSDSEHSDSEDELRRVDMSGLRYLLLHGEDMIAPADASETFNWTNIRAWLKVVLTQQAKETRNNSGFIHNFDMFEKSKTYVLLLDRRSITPESPQDWISGLRYKHLVSDNFLLVAYAVMGTTNPRAISLFDSTVHGKGFGSIFLDYLRSEDAFDSATGILSASMGFWEKEGVSIISTLH